MDQIQADTAPSVQGAHSVLETPELSVRSDQSRESVDNGIALLAGVGVIAFAGYVVNKTCGQGSGSRRRTRRGSSVRSGQSTSRGDAPITDDHHTSTTGGATDVASPGTEGIELEVMLGRQEAMHKQEERVEEEPVEPHEIV